MNLWEPDEVFGFLLRKEGFVLAAILGGITGFSIGGVGGAIGYAVVALVIYPVIAFLTDWERCLRPERTWYNPSQLGASATLRTPTWHLRVAERND